MCVCVFFFFFFFFFPRGLGCLPAPGSVTKAIAGLHIRALLWFIGIHAKVTIPGGGGANSKKVNTHPKIPEIDLDFY